MKDNFFKVEDGDKKGNTSGKGLRAKAACGIFAMKLTPRTPSLMPLDYAIWQKIDENMLTCEPSGKESKGDFKKRLA